MKRAAIFAAAVAICLGCGGGKSDAAASTANSANPSAGVTTAAPDSANAASVQSASSLTGTEYFGRAELARIASSLAGGSNPTYVFGRHPALWYVAARRVVSGSAEVHDDWIDVTFIQAGKATLLSGGSVSGARLTSAGEHRGGTISGGTTRNLGAGDLIIIPAGTPHQYQIASGDSLLYLTVKVLGKK